MHTFSLYTQPQPVDWIKKVNKSEYGHVAYQIWGKEAKTNVEDGGMWANSVDPDLAVPI